LLDRQPRADVLYRFFKRLFPAEINQHTDNKYFDKRTHSNGHSQNPDRNATANYADLMDETFGTEFTERLAALLPMSLSSMRLDV